MLTVFLMNGFQMRGIITGFDQFGSCCSPMDGSR